MLMTEIELKPSRILGLLVLTMGGLALVSIALASMPMAVKTMLAVIALGGALWAFRNSRRALPRLQLGADGSLRIRAGDDDWQSALGLPESFVSPALCVVRLAQRERRHPDLVLLPDSGEPDDLRRLRVSLQWARRTHLDTASPDAG
jgi:toxin CptA